MGRLSTTECTYLPTYPGRRGDMRDAVAATARVLGPQEARMYVRSMLGGAQYARSGAPGPPCWRGRWRKAECAQGVSRKALRYAWLMAV